MATKTKTLGLTKAAGSEKYSIDVVNENLDKVDEAIGELRESLGENSPIVTALEAIKTSIESDTTSAEFSDVKALVNGNSDKLTALQTTVGNTKTVVDAVNTNTVTVKQNTESLMQSSEGIVAKVEDINANVSENGTAISDLDSKADVISGQVQTVGNDVSSVKTDIASVRSSVNTANTNISSIKTTIESTSGKVDTLIANNRLKSFVYAKMPAGGSGKWLTVCEITGRGAIEKAIALAGSATGWQMRITVDDAVVYWSTANANSWIGVIKDCNFNNSALYQMAMNTAGRLALIAITIGTTGEWRNSFPGENNVASCVAVVPGGIRFYKNFKVEMYDFTGAVTIGGEITETSTAVTL